MTKNILLAALCLGIMAGCKKSDDDNVHATENMPNWLEVKEEWRGEWNTARYPAYRDHNITLLANDSIGTIDLPPTPFGYSLQYTERFNLMYNIFSSTTDVKVVLSKDSTALLKAAEIIKRDVLPYYPKDYHFRPNGILLADSLVVTQEYMISKTSILRIPTAIYAFPNSIRGVGAGMVDALNDMTEAEQKIWAGHIIAAKTASWLRTYKETELNAFDAITNKGLSSGTYYGKFYTYNTSSSNIYNKVPQEVAGFFGWQVDGQDLTPKRRMFPSLEQDLHAYMAAAYAFRDDIDAFTAQYGTYNGKEVDTTKIVGKYNIILGLIKSMEETLEINQ